MLILLRGNSGSGKSTTARLLRDKILELRPSRKVAIIEQDYWRRYVLKEKETEGSDNIGLIEQTVRYVSEHDYDVIVEGIFYSKRYGDMLRRLLAEWAENHVYYFDISLDETLRRHATKPNAHEFGEMDMRGWYHAHDVLGTKNERVLSETLSQDEIVDKILSDSHIGAT